MNYRCKTPGRLRYRGRIEEQPVARRAWQVAWTLLDSQAVFILIQGQLDGRNGDTMVLDSVAGHRKTLDKLAAFLASPERSIEIEAPRQCHLCPGWPTLRAFRMVKSDHKVRTEELPDGVLQVSGRPELLVRYIEHFRFEPGEEGAHKHPEQAFWGELAPGSAVIIIEVDDYADAPERWAG